MLPVPPRLKFHGNTHAAKQFKRFALSQLEILKKQMSFQGLKQGVRRVSPFEGVLIECVSKFGLHVVNVFVVPISYGVSDKGYELQKYEHLKKVDEKIVVVPFYCAGAITSSNYFQTFDVDNTVVPVKIDSLWSELFNKRTYSGRSFIQVKNPALETGHGGTPMLAINSCNDSSTDDPVTHIRATLSWMHSECALVGAPVDLINDTTSLPMDTVITTDSRAAQFTIKQVEILCNGQASASFNETNDILYVASLVGSNHIFVWEIGFIMDAVTGEYNWNVVNNGDFIVESPYICYPVFVDKYGDIHGIYKKGTSVNEPGCIAYNNYLIEEALGSGSVDFDGSCHAHYSTEYYKIEISYSTTPIPSYISTGNTGFISNMVKDAQIDGMSINYNSSQTNTVHSTSGDGLQTLDNVHDDNYILAGVPMPSWSQHIQWSGPAGYGTYEEIAGGEPRFTIGMVWNKNKIKFSNTVWGNSFGDSWSRTPPDIEEIIYGEIHIPFSIDDAEGRRVFVCIDNSVSPPITIEGIYYRKWSNQAEENIIIRLNDIDITDIVFSPQIDDTEGNVIERYSLFTENEFRHIGLFF
jgi:hypothetical protein